MIGCRPLSTDEYRMVLRAFHGPCEHRNRLLFVLGVSTGFRISELLSLKLGDVWKHDKPVTRIRVRRAHMKGAKASRSVLLSPHARNCVHTLLAFRSLRDPVSPDDPLFQGRKNKTNPITRTQAYRILRDAFEYCELDLTTPGTHTMRKTFAATLFEAFEGNVFKLQRALGHASPASTVAYLSFDESELDQAVESAWSQPEEFEL